MATIETIKLNVLEKAHDYAKIYASLLSEEFQRKRAYASIVALYSLVDALEKTDVNVQKSMTLFRNPKLNEQYEITDLYVNNWHLDVRVITDGDGVLIPKLHFENNLLADFYAVVKVDKTLQNAELLGFVEGAKIEATPFDNNYNSVLLSSLITYGEFLLKVSYEKDNDFKDEEHEFFQNSYLSLMDDETDVPTRNKLLSHMFNCNECRTEFCCFTGFEMVSCNASKYDDILTDKTLEVVGANAVDDKKYEGKEETIYFDENEQKSLENENIADNSETTEETVSDILDELFSINEMTEEPEIEEKTVETNIEVQSIEDVVPIQSLEPQFSEIEEIKEVTEIEEVSNIEDINDDIMNTPPLRYIDDANVITEDIAVEDEANLITTIGENIEIIEDEISDDMNLIEETKAKETTQLEQAETPDLEIHEHLDEETFVGNLDMVEECDIEMHENEETNELLVEENEDEIDNLTFVDEAKEEESELEFHNDVEIDEYKEHNAEPVAQPSKENVQKVIVDYDENGEPIYSYVNGVENINTNPEEESPLTMIVDNDDDVLNEKFETYEVEETSININNGAARPIEYIENEENVLFDENEVESQDLETIKNTEDETEEFDFEEDNTSSVNLDGNILESDDEEEYESEDETSEDGDEDDEYEDDEYEDDEYEDDEEYEDDDYEDDEDEEGASSKGKLGLIIGVILTLAIIIGGGVGAFIFLKNKDSNVNVGENQNPENNIQENQMIGMEIPNNDMFGDPQQQPQNEQQNNQEPQEVQGELVIADNSQEQLPPPPEPPKEENPVPPLTEADLLPVVNNEPVSDPNQAIANAFANNGKAITIKNINWLCARELFADKTFNNYLQKLDNMLKLNLRKNILDANERPKTDTVSVKLAVDNMGNLLKVMVSDSSGSNVIDDIVLRSINETFENEKSQILNGGKLKADKYYLKVVIKL